MDSVKKALEEMNSVDYCDALREYKHTFSMFRRRSMNMTRVTPNPAPAGGVRRADEADHALRSRAQ